MNTNQIKSEILDRVAKLLPSECYPKTYSIVKSHTFAPMDEIEGGNNPCIEISSAIRVCIEGDEVKVEPLYGHKNKTKRFMLSNPEVIGDVVVYIADTLGRIVRVRRDYSNGTYVEILGDEENPPPTSTGTVGVDTGRYSQPNSRLKRSYP